MRINQLHGKRVVITSGPTWVAVDDMRVISNKSTGALGAGLAKRLHDQGAQVTLIEGPVTCGCTTDGIIIKKFQYFDELLALLKNELRKPCAAVIHAAAVSDYQLSRPFGKKIRSDLKTLKLSLVPTLKIINQIRLWNPEAYLVAFKLESSFDRNSAIAKARAMNLQTGARLVVVNSVKENYQGLVIDPLNGDFKHADSRNKAARIITAILKEQL